MNENYVLEMEEYLNFFGKVEIVFEVIEVIVGIVVFEVEGVFVMRGNFVVGVVEKLGKKNYGKGVKVDLIENGIKVDVFCMMKFGVFILNVV